MLLSDGDMRAKINDGSIGLDPYDPDLVQPSSIDLRLGEGFRLMEPGEYAIDTRDVHDYTRFVGPAGTPDGVSRIVLRPGDFMLAHTLERVKLPDDIAAKVEGKSSLGRVGLLLHATAGFIDPGFEGTITLELSVVAPRSLLLYSGMKIGQICFFSLSSPAEQPYGSARLGSRYQGQSGPTASRYTP